MKAFFLFLMFCLLMGCQSAPVKPKEPLAYSQMEAWSIDKGYVQKIVSLNQDYDSYNIKYNMDVTDQKFIISTYNSTLVYEMDTKSIRLDRKENFHYVKNNELKYGTLEYTWYENENTSVIEGTFSNETDTYPIAFDFSTMTITDHEEGSETYGQPMKFIQGIKNRIVHEMIKSYNQLTLQKQVFERWHQLADTVTSEEDINNLPDATELALDTSELLESSYKRESIQPRTIQPCVISIDEDFFITLWNANSLEKTLFLAAHINSEFDNPEQIHWDDVLTPVLGISENHSGIEDFQCILHGQSYYADYNHQNGYFTLVHLDDLNETVRQLSGIQNIYLPKEDQTLTDDALYDAKLNAYIVCGLDGEFVNRDPGIVILNQETSGNRIIYDLVIYQTEHEDSTHYVNGFSLGTYSDFTNENDLMKAAYDTVLQNIDAFNHWRLVIEKQNENQLYQLISMHIIN